MSDELCPWMQDGHCSLSDGGRYREALEVARAEIRALREQRNDARELYEIAHRNRVNADTAYLAVKKERDVLKARVARLMEAERRITKLRKTCCGLIRAAFTRGVERNALKAENERLRTAIAPFATYYHPSQSRMDGRMLSRRLMPDEPGYNDGNEIGLTALDFKRARAASGSAGESEDERHEARARTVRQAVETIVDAAASAEKEAKASKKTKRKE